MATHSSSLAWRISWTEEPGGYSPWSLKESDMTEQTCTHVLEIIWAKPRGRTAAAVTRNPVWPPPTAAPPLAAPEMLLVFSRNSGSHCPTASFPLSFPPEHLIFHIQSPAQEEGPTSPSMFEQNPLTQAPFSYLESLKEVRGVFGDTTSETWLFNVH